MMLSCDFRIERETEKAVYAEVKTGECGNTTRYQWLPKSAIEMETFVQTVNQATNKPETYGKRVVAIESWLKKSKDIK
nr:MAG TPA: hypothetical protein [Caudoviricetes sp.]